MMKTMQIVTLSLLTLGLTSCWACTMECVPDGEGGCKSCWEKTLDQL